MRTSADDDSKMANGKWKFSGKPIRRLEAGRTELEHKNRDEKPQEKKKDKGTEGKIVD